MRALRYRIRFPVVLKYFGQLNFVLAALALVPLTVAVLFSDYNISLRDAIVTGFLFASGLGISRLPVPGRIQTNEAMVICNRSRA